MNASDALPDELPLLLLHGVVVFPLTVTPLAVSRPASVRMVDDAVAGTGVVAVATQRNGEDSGFFAVGVAARVHRLVRLHDGTLRIALEAFERIAIGELLQRAPYPRARVQPLPDIATDATTGSPLAQEALARAHELLDAMPGGSDELRAQLDAADPRRLAALLASTLLLHAGIAERQALLELPGPDERLQRLYVLLAQELAALRGHLRI